MRSESGAGSRPWGGDPLWYKDAVIYELHVRAFRDGDGDGSGDFAGLTEKLDYLVDLGVTAVWLLPFYPSPLKDDGYDIADYFGVHPAYGTLSDFRRFVREAHRRGLRVITELVLNHTSDQHEWFQRARRAPPGSRWRDFYVWSDTPDKYRDARIIFRDFETSNWTWDPIARAYYWHRFYAHQPDLNYANPEVMLALFRVLDFWLTMGVDGLRLDAVPYLFEREGTSCENLSETHEALRRLREHVDGAFEDRMLLAEANQWPEDAVAYFGQGDECHMAFHFPFMPRMFMALSMEDRYPIVDILEQTPAIPEGCQWALFLRNHDELTLEMVTDEERDYMYRMYARDRQARINLGIRRRLAPLLGNGRRQMELLHGLLFSLPGTPVLYYGDELGMGDNIYLGDRDSVRTPMQWSSDRNAGFSAANPQRLYLPVVTDPGFHYESVNVETQLNSPHSFLWWLRRLIALRRRHAAFGRGELEFLHPSNSKVLAFLRKHGDERILVVANLSRFLQPVELDLHDFEGLRPVEILGQTVLPPVGERPYFLTLGPHAFSWFTFLKPAALEGVGAQHRDDHPLPAIAMRKGKDAAALLRSLPTLESALGAHLRGRKWFQGSALRIKRIGVADAFSPGGLDEPATLLMITLEYTDGHTDGYLLAPRFAKGQEAERLLGGARSLVLARVEGASGSQVIYDALEEPDVLRAIFDAHFKRRPLAGRKGVLALEQTPLCRNHKVANGEKLELALLHEEETKTTVRFGSRFVMKLHRRLEPGIHPEEEIAGKLSGREPFPHMAPLLGAFIYRPRLGPTTLVGTIFEYVHNEGDAWTCALDYLGRYYEDVVSSLPALAPLPEGPAHLWDLVDAELPEPARRLIGAFTETARLLGTRTAELHLRLASEKDDPAFAPEAFTPFYQRSLFQSLRNELERVFQGLRSRLSTLDESLRPVARRLLGQKEQILKLLRARLGEKIDAMRIRVHGDYHLEQVLWTGKDFSIIDFEGETVRSLEVRRIKQMPLRDVADMVRSFHYAAHSALHALVKKGVVREKQLESLEPWARSWFLWVSRAFLESYVAKTREAEPGIELLPQDRKNLKGLLTIYLLEKAVYELGHELANRPDWVWLPMKGIAEILDWGEGD